LELGITKNQELVSRVCFDAKKRNLKKGYKGYDSKLTIGKKKALQKVCFEVEEIHSCLRTGKVYEHDTILKGVKLRPHERDTLYKIYHNLLDCRLETSEEKLFTPILKEKKIQVLANNMNCVDQEDKKGNKLRIGGNKRSQERARYNMRRSQLILCESKVVDKEEIHSYKREDEGKYVCFTRTTWDCFIRKYTLSSINGEVILPTMKNLISIFNRNLSWYRYRSRKQINAYSKINCLVNSVVDYEGLTVVELSEKLELCSKLKNNLFKLWDVLNGKPIKGSLPKITGLILESKKVTPRVDKIYQRTVGLGHYLDVVKFKNAMAEIVSKVKVIPPIEVADYNVPQIKDFIKTKLKKTAIDIIKVGYNARFRKYRSSTDYEKFKTVMFLFKTSKSDSSTLLRLAKQYCPNVLSEKVVLYNVEEFLKQNGIYHEIP
jgi:hypothetical protein